MTVRNRIKGHRTVRAGDLVPHEMNFRTHTDSQRNALAALYGEVGFARSLLVYELPDGRLKLIDGHLRQSMDPDAEVTVEVLDVTDSEARALLLAIDPLAQLAGRDIQVLTDLRETVEKDSQAVASLWAAIDQAEEDTRKALQKTTPSVKSVSTSAQFMILITCQDENDQADLLTRLRRQGIQCKPMLS